MLDTSRILAERTFANKKNKNQPDKSFLAEQEKVRRDRAEKTDRLRKLRLEKEAEANAAALKLAEEKAAAKIIKAAKPSKAAKASN